MRSRAPGFVLAIALYALAATATTAGALEPIQWRPWGIDAVEEARGAQRPILLLIGDRWSHPSLLLDRTTLQDPAVTALIASQFVPIRASLAQRPDLGAVYTAGLRALTKRVGWPLVVFIDPSTMLPFEGGTSYEPLAFDRLLQHAGAIWAEQRDDVAAVGERAALGIASGLARPEPGALGAELVDRAAAQLLAAFDRRCGGFRRGRLKEPHAPELRLLLETAWDDSAARVALLYTLDRMGVGAIDDQVGGGFHASAADQCWAVPRFEKTLAVNAQLASVYAIAHERTGDAFYADRAAGALDWAMRALALPNGAFGAATLAESDSRDGAAYAWAPGEAENALAAAGLGPGDVEFAIKIYGVGRPLFRDPERPGEPALMVPRLAGRPDDLAARLGLSQEEFDHSKSRVDAALRAQRHRRPPPLADAEVLAGWNGLAIAALVDGARALRQPRYLEAAVRAARASLAAPLRDDAFLEDYAFLIFGLLALEEATGDPGWLEHAIALEAAARDRFRDVATGGLFDAPAGGPTLPLRFAATDDGDVPAAGGVMLGNLLELHERTTDPRYLDDAVAMLSTMSGAINRNPAGSSGAVIALDRLLREHAERVGASRAETLPANPVTVGVSAATATVGREHDARFEVTLDVAAGCRVIAHGPGAPAGGLLVELAGRGFVLEAAYPAGEPGCGAGLAEPVLSHAGRVVIPIVIRRQDDASSHGPAARPRLVLRYQVCTDALRPAPQRLLVPIEITAE